MSYVGERVAYLKGLAEGMDIQADTPENKLLLKMLEVMEDIADSISMVEEEQDDISEALTELVDGLMGEHDHYHDHDDYYPGGPEEEDADVVEYDCPHCGVTVYFDKEVFKTISKDIKCPECGLDIFPKSELPES